MTSLLIEVQALKKLKNYKAAERHPILPKYLKNGGDSLAVSLTRICNEVWATEKVPRDWKNEIILPLPKQAGIHPDPAV